MRSEEINQELFEEVYKEDLLFFPTLIGITDEEAKIVKENLQEILKEYTF